MGVGDLILVMGWNHLEKYDQTNDIVYGPVRQMMRTEICWVWQAKQDAGFLITDQVYESGQRSHTSYCLSHFCFCLLLS